MSIVINGLRINLSYRPFSLNYWIDLFTAYNITRHKVYH